MIVLGVDPGLSGAVVSMVNGEVVDCTDMPRADGEVSAGVLAQWIQDAITPNSGGVIAVVERVASRPGQGVSSTFKFGAAYGAAKGVLGALGIRTILVTPVTWKRHFCLPGGDDGKKKGLALARRTWPTSNAFSREKDHGRADAALIAQWAIDTGHC